MSDRLRPCRPDEAPAILAIVNAAAQAYRGIIPDDCWHDPYMTAAALDAELAAGVRFAGLDEGGELIGVMGLQRVRNVDLIRHAYVRPDRQGGGIGGALIAELCAARTRPILVGTWAAATWAIRFYERHGFALAPAAATDDLLRAYWTVPTRQRSVSVVLASPPVDAAGAAALIAAG